MSVFKETRARWVIVLFRNIIVREKTSVQNWTEFRIKGGTAGIHSQGVAREVSG